MVGIFTMSVGNVKEWSENVSNRLDSNYLRSNGNLKSTKNVYLLSIIIMQLQAR